MNLARLGLVPVFGLLPVVSFGCSDPAPPTPRGAWRVSFVDPGLDCPIAGHDAFLGKVDASTEGAVIVDGQDKTSISCSVTGSGSFNVSAKGDNLSTAQGGILDIKINGISSAATRESPALGTVAFASTETGGSAATSSEPCHFWFVPNTKEGVDTGKIWVAFECPKMLIQGGSCQIAQSYAAFENCDT
jgi:hypothetical protein